MMIKKLLQAGITIAGLTVAGGAIAKKPLLIHAGMNVGLSAGIGHLVAKQDRQKQSVAIASTQPDLSTIEAILAKHQKQLKEQCTRQNLTLSKVSKLDRKQKVTAIAISQQVDKLIELAEDNTAKKSAKVTQIKKPVKLTSIRQPVTRIYVDGNNLSCTAREMEIDIDYKALRLYLMEGKSEFNYYRGVAQNPTLAHQRFVGSLEKYGYRVTQLPVVRFADGTVKTIGDDMTMGMDVLEESRKGDRVILVTGDGDFLPVVKRIQAKGVKVTVVGRRANTSSELRYLADDYLDLEAIKYQIAVHTKLSIV